MRGKGDLKYMGGGLMFRSEWDNGFRLEALAWAGKNDNDFRSADLKEVDGTEAVYNFKSPYLSKHFGLAKTFKLNEANYLDLLGRYYWSKQYGGEVTLSNGEKMTFGDDKSHKVRLGLRYGHKINNRLSWYLGAAGEKEFDGKITANTHGFELDSPILKSNTVGVGDLGMIIRSEENSPLSLEIGVQGYCGGVRGWTGGVRFGWEF
jgi:outer membrane autotransporter protein